METETGFDVEGFGKIVALFDSDKVGEAQNAFTKAVLLCRKHGLRFADAAGVAFGNADTMRQQLESQFNAEVEGGFRVCARVGSKYVAARLAFARVLWQIYSVSIFLIREGDTRDD